jgi:hypothetical protein
MVKEKLNKTNASILYNKICKIEKLTPKYIHVTVNGNDQKSVNTNNNNNNNNNHGSTALYGLGPPLASSFRGY